MSRAATSMFVWGIYTAVTGLTFLVVPNVPLELLGFGATDEIWIRVLAVVLIVLGYYYLRTARHEIAPFFGWTVHARAFVVVAFVLFVVLGLAAPMLLLFAATETLGTIWTAWALRSSQQQPAPVA